MPASHLFLLLSGQRKHLKFWWWWKHLVETDINRSESYPDTLITNGIVSDEKTKSKYKFTVQQTSINEFIP